MIFLVKFEVLAGDDLNVEVQVWHSWQFSTAGDCNASRQARVRSSNGAFTTDYLRALCGTSPCRAQGQGFFLPSV
jgi:hypothetical protein